MERLADKMSYIHDLLKMAVEKNASDIFITVGVPPVLKINGELVTTEAAILFPKDSESIIKELFTKEEYFNDYVAEGEKDFSISMPGLGRFRINVYMQRGSMAAAIRVVKFDLPDPVKLGVPEEVLNFYKRTKGLILVTGPTGSGKSTTLSAIIDRINSRRSCHILTLEDPIEFLHKHNKSIVNQREIGIDTKAYSRALRSAMRQSPDVILIGEMRDLETISIALTAAETGHLVLSTLHTLGAAKTIDRVIDVFPPNQQQQARVQLSTILQAVVTQQLVPTKDKGLVPAYEIMIVNSAIRNLIRDAKIPQIDAAIQTGRSTGMITMDMSLAELYKKDIITKETATTYCVSEDALLRYIS